MTVPQPSSAVGSQLLQEVWDIAVRSQRWPTVAEMDEHHPHDLATADILREFPPGLIYGVGPEHAEPPGSAFRLRLTVAAIASCRYNEDVVSAFLQFMQQVGRRGVSGKSGLGAFLRLNDTSISKRIISGISDRYTLAGSGRVGDELAEGYARDLLRLVVTVETAGWALVESEDDASSLLGEPGHWVIDIDQGIGDFADVTDLDDYWSRRFKPWEGDSLDIAIARNAEKIADPYNRAHTFSTNPELIDDVLLASIEATAEGRTKAFIPCSPFDYKISSGLILKSLQRLARRGHILRPTLYADPGFPTVALTPAGITHLKSRRATWANPVYRNRAARNAVLSWLYDQRDHPQGYVPVQNFLRDSRSIDSGYFFSSNDLEAAGSYLVEQGLIRGTNIDQLQGPGLARITARGMDCIEEGGNVSDYLKHSATGGSNITFNGPVAATNIAGDNARQYAVSHGITTTEVRDLMQAIIEAVPELGLPSAQASEIRVIATHAITEADGGSPDRTKFQLAAQRLRALLAASGRTALSATLTALINAALVKAGLPPGGGA
jgi:hypothetical protein